MSEQERRREARDRREREWEEVQAERVQIEAEYGTTGMSQRVRDLIWNKAWEDGHASGMHEVRMQYDDLADIAKAALNGDKP